MALNIPVAVFPDLHPISFFPAIGNRYSIFMKNSSNMRSNYSQEKKNKFFGSPDLSKLQEVKIDFRTKIYIAIGADPEEARLRYLERVGNRNIR